MVKSLVGYTGFVGSNIYNYGEFDNVYNSKNIESAYDTNPDLLVYSGISAEKYLANRNPEEDYKKIESAIYNIKRINPASIVLISTIDVYKRPIDVDENSMIETEGLEPYGLNRYYLEKWVEENFENSLIVRLPGLYGINIKKNFIYDIIHRIPFMLTNDKIAEISEIKSDIYEFYDLQDNGFYKCKQLDREQMKLLKNFFILSDFSALNFTDSRGRFQYYNLKYLWHHIEIALSNNIKKLNLATEPILISELYNYLTGMKFENEILKSIPDYRFKTIHDDAFNGCDGFICNKDFVKIDIKQFIEEYEV